jgi:hypothetical protein
VGFGLDMRFLGCFERKYFCGGKRNEMNVLGDDRMQLGCEGFDSRLERVGGLWRAEVLRDPSPFDFAQGQDDGKDGYERDLPALGLYVRHIR